MSYDLGTDAALETLGLDKEAAALHRVRSRSVKGRRYSVRKHDDGRYTCSCPDYKYRHAGRGTHCKHIEGRKS
jgi:hypothetical protein